LQKMHLNVLISLSFIVVQTQKRKLLTIIIDRWLGVFCMDRILKQLRIDDIKRKYQYQIADTEHKSDGITVAVLDSGMCPSHPDLYGTAIAFYDFVNHRKHLYDDYGHGTHICGCIAGKGKMSLGKYRGIAENTRFVIGKVLDKSGNGNIKDMIQGMEWVITNQERYQIKVMNISVGTGQGYQRDEYRHIMKLMEEAWKAGILVVCAAGNGGPKKDSISYIGVGQYSITVGCHDGEYENKFPNSCYKHSGVGTDKSSIRKPDIVAPGTGIYACQTLAIGRKDKKTRYYCRKSGTSMATAIVSGVASLFFELKKDADNEYCKRKMIYTTKDLGESWNKQGYGMIQPYEMLK